MDPSSAQSHLLEALATHQIPLGDKDVTWAFGNPKTVTQTVDWVERYLRKNTLVSLEEAEIYNHLKKTGNFQKLQRQHPELHLVRPRSEETLRVEIDELKASTEMLKQQTAQLKKQKAGLKAMRERIKAEKERKKKVDERRRRKWLIEKENIQAAIDDLLGILQEEVADFKQSAKASEIDLEGAVKILGSDDRMLGRLAEMAEGITLCKGGEGTKEDEVVERVTVLVRKLAMLSAAALKARLDRMFLEIVSPEADNSNSGSDADAVAELKRDLETLYSDIPSVAEMAVEQEYLKPVRKEVEEGKRKAGESLTASGAYIRDSLLYLQRRNISVTEKLKKVLARAGAVSQIIATIEQESKSPLSKPEESLPAIGGQRRHSISMARPITPIKHPQPFKNMPIFTPPNRRRGASMDLGRGDFKNSDDEFPELRMLTLLGVPVPPTPSVNTMLFMSPIKGIPVVPNTAELPASRLKYLDTQVLEKSKKLQSQEQDMSNEVQIQETIDEFWNVARIAEDALTGDNMFPPLLKEHKHMSFVSEELIMGIAEIEKGVNSVASRMGGLSRGLEELERMGGDLQGQGREKKAFVERWGRQ